MKPKYVFISLDGVDGVGKTTVQNFSLSMDLSNTTNLQLDPLLNCEKRLMLTHLR